MVDGSRLPRSIRWRIQLGLLNVPELPTNEDEFLAKLTDGNRDSLTQQRSRYETLAELHFANLEHSDDDDDDEEDSDEDEAEEDLPLHAEEEEDLSLDPLTAMVMEQEARDKRREELDLKYRKEKARRKRGLQVESENDDRWKDENFSPTQTLGVIAKDLNRLQPEHHTYHHSRKNLSQHHDSDNNNNNNSSCNSGDGESQGSFEISVKERTDELSQILTVHALEHPEMGYRQGMHEICSYLMLVVEMDLFDQETIPTKSSIHTFKQKSSFNNNQKSMDLTDHSQEEVHLVQSDFLLDEHFKLHDVYAMFETIMVQLQRAYDVTNENGQTTSMEVMGRSVITKLRTVACDHVLFKFVSRLTFPPQLYCTRWIRLMFSREVTGWRNVLLLWDVFFDFVTVCPYIYTLKTDEPAILASLGQFQLQDVLENTAASMILMVRMKLLKTQDPNESIQILMNYEPFLDVASLSETLQSMMQRLYAKDGFTPIRPTVVIKPTNVASSSAAQTPGGGGSNEKSAIISGLMDAMQSMDSSFRDLMNSSRKSIVSEDSTEEAGRHSSPSKPTTPTTATTGPQQALSTPIQPTNVATAATPHGDFDPLLGVMPTPSKVMTSSVVTSDPWVPIAKPKETLFSSMRRLVTRKDETPGVDSLDPIVPATGDTAASAGTEYIHMGPSSKSEQIVSTLPTATAPPPQLASNVSSALISSIAPQPKDAFVDFAESTGLFEADDPSPPLSTLSSEKLRPAKPYKADPEMKEDEALSQWVLAEKLNQSMLCIQNYLTHGQPVIGEEGQAPLDAAADGNFHITNGTVSSSVPQCVWEALAEIDVVRKQLLRTEGDESGHTRSQHKRSQTDLDGMIL